MEIVNNKKISVLMSTYNEPVEWIKMTLDSIINQTYMPSEIVIVVDNPDNKELLEYLYARKKDNSIISVHVNEKNLGLVKSLNIGLNYCSNELVARIDADDIALESRFEKQIEFMENEEADVVGTGYYRFYDDVIFSTVNGVENSNACSRILNYSNILAHPTWMMKKKVADAIGGYREIDSCEDLDFLQRAVLAGFKVANVKEPLLKYRDNPDSISHKKHIKQMLTKELLCRSYRKRKTVSYETYCNYIQSARYAKDYKRLEGYAETYNRDKKIVSVICHRELLLLIRLKLKNAYINYWKNR